MLKSFFGNSCFPGALDWRYVRTNNVTTTALCNLCFEHGNDRNGIEISNESEVNQPIKTCAADKTNKYFGNRGALKCLDEVGDIAVLELQSLRVHAEEVKVPEHNFRILCKNNTLAKEIGFDVDLNCPLTTIVDGEIVMYRKSPKTSSVVHVLKALEHYFIRKNDPSFKIYNIYEGQRNLLFKDSTVGLTHPDSPNQGLMVENYKNLFKDVEECYGNSAAIISTQMLSTLSILIFVYILNF